MTQTKFIVGYKQLLHSFIGGPGKGAFNLFKITQESFVGIRRISFKNKVLKHRNSPKIPLMTDFTKKLDSKKKIITCFRSFCEICVHVYSPKKIFILLVNKHYKSRVT